MSRNKKILYIVLFVIAIGLAHFVYSIMAPKKSTPGFACIQVVTIARHPILPFIKKTFGNPCIVPNGWIIVN